MGLGSKMALASPPLLPTHPRNPFPPIYYTGAHKNHRSINSYFNPADIHSKAFIWILLTLTAINFLEPCSNSQKVISCTLFTFVAIYLLNMFTIYNSNFLDHAHIHSKVFFRTLIPEISFGNHLQYHISIFRLH